MCHKINWYHALCGHTAPDVYWLLECETTIKTGWLCLDSDIERISFPMSGMCERCRYKEYHLRRIAVNMQKLEKILNAAEEAVEELFDAADALNGDVAREVGQERRPWMLDRISWVDLVRRCADRMALWVENEMGPAAELEEEDNNSNNPTNNDGNDDGYDDGDYYEDKSESYDPASTSRYNYISTTEKGSRPSTVQEKRPRRRDYARSRKRTRDSDDDGEPSTVSRGRNRKGRCASPPPPSPAKRKTPSGSSSDDLSERSHGSGSTEVTDNFLPRF
ncbi:hypothetical protein VTN00DRAFT_1398 [Thermoascus crustaceus]|uniref:uncharacterized protein n=1 Tax=Thermoascus crustaceus TaxID=5088 RepID=UPI0037432A0B